MTQPLHPRAQLARSGLRPRKKYGQNFLVDSVTAQRIAALCVTGEVARVIEIGAGTGALTSALLGCGAKLTAIEIDPNLVSLLRGRDDLNGAEIVETDALTFDYGGWAHGEPWIVAGNLPYNVATPLITHFAEMQNGPQRIVATIQKDVADRLVALPGTPAYGSLTVAVGVAMAVSRAFDLKPQAFYPAPNVDSTVVQLSRRSEPAVVPRDVALFRKVVRAAFAYRRKTFVNSLALALDIPRATIAAAAADAHLSAEQRGERLDLHDFSRLADALAARQL